MAQHTLRSAVKPDDLVRVIDVHDALGYSLYETFDELLERYDLVQELPLYVRR